MNTGSYDTSLEYINPGGSYYYFYGETIRIRMGISFFLIGFAYFIRRDVTLGLFGLGTRAMTPSGLVALGFTYSWAADLIILVMATAANGLKVVEESVRHRRRLLFWSMITVLVVSLSSSIYVKLDVAYEHGGLNTAHTFGEQGFYQWEDAAMRLGTMTDVNWGYWGPCRTRAR